MTMQNTPHPDDELLSAFAGADRDTVADRALTDHLATCERCQGIVNELALLRSALSELPDMTPSRPLQLLPPVPEPVQRGASGWLRRLVAPVVATGAGLLLVGAVGSAGLLGQVSLFGAAGAAPDREITATDSAYVPSAGIPDATQGALAAGSPAESPAESPAGSPAESPAGSPSAPPSDRSNDDTTGKSTDGGTEVMPSGPAGPWTVLLVAGAGLVIGGLLLRYSLEPRAG